MIKNRMDKKVIIKLLAFIGIIGCFGVLFFLKSNTTKFASSAMSQDGIEELHVKSKEDTGEEYRYSVLDPNGKIVWELSFSNRENRLNFK